MQRVSSFVMCLGLVIAAGCGKDKGKSADDGKVASCNVDTLFTCREYRGGNLALGTKQLAELCTTLVSTAKFTETACPTVRLIGTCTKPEGKDFFYEGYEGGDVAKSCTDLGGTYSAK